MHASSDSVSPPGNTEAETEERKFFLRSAGKTESSERLYEAALSPNRTISLNCDIKPMSLAVRDREGIRPIVLVNEGGEMNRSLAILVLSIFLTGLGFGQTETSQKEAILKILELQKAAWNRADIEEFMAYYLKSADITFQSANSRIMGWDEVLARYKKSYTPENMGTLDFTDLSVNILSEDTAYVLGRFQLDIGGEHREGLFTIILNLTPKGWRIIHDHTSSESSSPG